MALGNADVHVQAAEQVAASHDLEVVDEAGVPVLVGVALVLPGAEGMRAGGIRDW